MSGLTNLGIIHTAISLVALAAGAVSLARYKEISAESFIGKLYIWTTVITCLTGFPIVQHGGFGAPHALGVLTLVVLVIAATARKTNVFGGISRYVETIGYSATFFFHWIPTIVETSTRLPLGSPLVTDREGPEIQVAIGIVFLLFLIGVALQVRHMRSSGAS
jgi:uncharacterized membrane protein